MRLLCGGWTRILFVHQLFDGFQTAWVPTPLWYLNYIFGRHASCKHGCAPNQLKTVVGPHDFCLSTFVGRHNFGISTKFSADLHSRASGCYTHVPESGSTHMISVSQLWSAHMVFVWQPNFQLIYTCVLEGVALPWTNWVWSHMLFVFQLWSADMVITQHVLSTIQLVHIFEFWKDVGSSIGMRSKEGVATAPFHLWKWREAQWDAWNAWTEWDRRLKKECIYSWREVYIYNNILCGGRF